MRGNADFGLQELVSLVPAEPTSAIFAVNILQYTSVLDVLTISQNIAEGLILPVHIFYGSLVCVAGTIYVAHYISYKEMLNFILTGGTHQVIGARKSK